MGGPGASDDLSLAAVTQAWLAVSDDPEALVTGRHFYHQHTATAARAASSEAVQDGLLAACASITGTELPAAPTVKGTS